MPSLGAGRSVRLFCTFLCIVMSFGGCAGFTGQEPLRVNVAGVGPLESEGLEMRLNVKLRVQNPNDSPVEYDGMSLQLELNGEPFASGVSDQRGVVPRFGETLIEVPVTVPAFAVVRQAFAFGNSEHAGRVPYKLYGRLGGSMIGGTRFVRQGTLSLPAAHVTGQ
jgi:hypothetical protein